MSKKMEITKHPTDIETMPVVWVYASSINDNENLRSIHLGLEEEGIPCRTTEVKGKSAHLLAIEAANASSLGVGIGIVESTREAVLHHRDLPDTEKLIEIKDETFTTEILRRLGANSARFVKGTPLVPLIEDEQEDVNKTTDDIPEKHHASGSQDVGNDIEMITRIVVEILKTFNFGKVGS